MNQINGLASNTGSVNAMYVATNGTMDGLNVLTTSGNNTLGYCDTGWNYWQNQYYPQVIRESYPVYIKEKSEDKGKQAFEIIKILQDKKLMKLEKVSDFIDAMDCLIKNL